MLVMVLVTIVGPDGGTDKAFAAEGDVGLVWAGEGLPTCKVHFGLASPVIKERGQSTHPAVRRCPVRIERL